MGLFKRITLILWLCILSNFLFPLIVSADEMDSTPVERSEKTVIQFEDVADRRYTDKLIRTRHIRGYRAVEETIAVEMDVNDNGSVKTTRPLEYRSLEWFDTETRVVTPLRVPVEQERASENIDVYTYDQIGRLPADNLTEALKYLPGVDVKVNSEFGQASSLSINGSASRQVRLMVDGIPFNTQLSGQANPTRIPVEYIEQIEIIKGASSSAWGSGLGGVINVVTKKPRESDGISGDVTLSAGEYDTQKTSLNLRGREGMFGFYASGGFAHSDGILSETDSERKDGFVKVISDLDEAGELTAQFGYDGADVQFGVTSGNRIRYSPYQTRYGLVSWRKEEETWDLSVAYKYNDQDLRTDLINATTGVVLSQTINNNVYQGISAIGHGDVFEDDEWTAGVDVEWQHLRSNNYLSDTKSLRTWAPFVNYIWRAGDFDIIPGLRYDENDHFGSQTSPSVGVVYHLPERPGARVRARVARGFNAPPLMWIYNSDPFFLVGPNPGLKPERALNYEVGFETPVTDRWDIELNAYHSRVKDAIGLRFEGGLFIQDNFEKYHRQGIEIQSRVKITEELGIWMSAAVNDVEDRTTGETVREIGVARQRYTLGANYQRQDGLGIYLSGYYNQWSAPASSMPNDSKPIFDLKLTKVFLERSCLKDITFFMTIHNLTNSSYWEDVDLPLPGRYFEGGMKMKF